MAEIIADKISVYKDGNWYCINNNSNNNSVIEIPSKIFNLLNDATSDEITEAFYSTGYHGTVYFRLICESLYNGGQPVVVKESYNDEKVNLPIILRYESDWNSSSRTYNLGLWHIINNMGIQFCYRRFTLYYDDDLFKINNLYTDSIPMHS